MGFSIDFEVLIEIWMAIVTINFNFNGNLEFLYEITAKTLFKVYDPRCLLKFEYRHEL